MGQGHISLIGWNITGLAGKFYGNIFSRNDFQKFITKFNIICLSETWANKHDNFLLKGYVEYSVIRKKHKKAKKNSGGISIFLAEFLNKHTTRHKSASENLLWLHINLKALKGGYNILLAALYVSPEGSPMHNEENIFQILSDELLQLRLRYKNAKVAILGDWNAYTACENDFLDNSLDQFDFFQENCHYFDLPKRHNMDTRDVNRHGRELLNFCINTNMCIANGRVGTDKHIGDFTCYFGKFPSVVDYLLTDCDLLNYIDDFYIANRLESHHLPICCSFKTSVALESKEKTYIECDLQRYRLKEDATQLFLEKLQSQNFQEIERLLNNEELEGALNQLNKYITTSADNMVENRIRKTDSRIREPWFNDHCLSLKKMCTRKLKLFRKSRNNDLLNDFLAAKKHYRNVYTAEKLNFKERERADLIENLKVNDSKEFWKIVRKNTQQKMNVGDVSLHVWADYFRKLFAKPTAPMVYDVELGEEFHNEILDKEINLQDVLKAINSLKNGMATGYDGIASEFYKISEPYISKYIVSIFNALYRNAYFPEIWTRALIMPLPKKGDLSRPENYRGISLLPIFSKIFTHILKEKLLKWCEQEHKICKEQAGFRKNHSTVDNVFIVDTLIRKYLRKKGGRFYCAFIDFSKAFDSVDRNALWQKLLQNNISTCMLKMLMNIYRSVGAVVMTNEGVSAPFECELGVKQGCILSPTLFSLFINDLPEALNQVGINRISLVASEINSLMFADDVIMFAESPWGLQKELDVLENYCHRWSLSVNVDKSKIMVFRNGGKLRNYEKWYYMGQEMSTCTYYPYLGVSFSSVHSWTYNQKIRAERAGKALFSIKRLMSQFKVTDSNLAFRLFDTKIVPILHYGSEIWGFHEGKDVERVQLEFCKNVLRLHRNTPDVAVRGELGRVPLRVNRYMNIVCFWFRLLSLKPERLTNQAYQLQLQWVDTNTECCALALKRLLMSHGFGEAWYNQGVGCTKTFKSIFISRCKDIEMQNWTSKIHDMDRLRYYKLFKNTLEREYYVDLVKKEDIAALSNFRCNSLPFRALTGHLYEKLPYENCFCQICKNNIVEDEYHFFMICPVYEGARKAILPRYLYTRPSKFKFIEFMKSNCEANVLITIKFVKEALKERAKITHS